MNLLSIIEKYGVDKLNTLTKYPSIQTYHEIDRGILKPNLTEDIGFMLGPVYVTEKVDGTNSRVIILNDDYIIGSREELLYRKGDTFGNPSQGIVNIMKPFAIDLCRKVPMDNKIRVFYGEVYGSNINGAKQYTKHRASNVRFFDILEFDENISKILDESIDYISIWRDKGNQPFLRTSAFNAEMHHYGYGDHMTPRLEIISALDIPSDRAKTYEWMKKYIKSQAIIDEEIDTGKSEGVVIRDETRSMIRKLRFEDYEKTLRKLGTL